MPDINEVAEKKLKSKTTKIKKVNKNEEEREKFFNQLGISLSFMLDEVPDDRIMGLIFRTSPEGKILDVEYDVDDDVEEFIPVADDDLKKYYDEFKDYKLELIDYKNEEEVEETEQEVASSLEVFMPNRGKKNLNIHDSVIFWTTLEGKVAVLEYSYMEEDNDGNVEAADPIDVPTKNIKHFYEAFKDFKLELDD
ncbi:hypothetical protein [uncultured Methanobrevibacter sp.]|uniref:hypothetical protein n=1 Tax=uncultured Methanobrevibacter sp. TaxID=253161 RepID=UPI0026DEBB53|nr:hypothetical protein [uncultured Methanobrevibacter sp.]